MLVIDLNNDGVKVGATYEATEEKIAKVDGFISKTGESADVRQATYESLRLVFGHHRRYVRLIFSDGRGLW